MKRTLLKLLAILFAFTLVAASFLVVARPTWHGLEPVIRYEAVEIRPDAGVREFYRELTARDDGGALLELPMRPRLREKVRRISMLSDHGRRTSTCENSFSPPEHEEVARLVRRIPSRGALTQLREMGFTTIVLHHPAGRKGSSVQPLRRELDRAVSIGSIEPLGATRQRSAFAIRVPHDAVSP